MTNHPLDVVPPNEPAASGGRGSRDDSPPPRRSWSSRIVRAGVGCGVAGFIITLIGAVLLGNGPSQFEVLGGSVHRIGMLMMQVALLVILAGYRWASLAAFFQPAVGLITDDSSEPSRERAMRDLFDSLPSPTAPPVVDAELAGARPATAPTADPTRQTRADDKASPPMATRYSSLPPTQPPPSVHTWGCLISAWSVIGIVFAFLGLLYWIVPTRDALWLSLLLDMLLVVVSLASAVAWTGRKRAFAIGFAVPLITMVIAKFPLVQSSMLIRTWMMSGNAPPFSELRVLDVAFHVLAPLTGGLGWLVVRTLEVMGSSEVARKDRPR